MGRSGQNLIIKIRMAKVFRGRREWQTKANKTCLLYEMRWKFMVFARIPGQLAFFVIFLSVTAQWNGTPRVYARIYVGVCCCWWPRVCHGPFTIQVDRNGLFCLIIKHCRRSYLSYYWSVICKKDLSHPRAERRRREHEKSYLAVFDDETRMIFSCPSC